MTPTPAPTPPATGGTPGITAAEALSSIPGVPSADDILAKVLASPQFGVFEEKQQLAKQLGIAGAQTEKEALETKTKTATQEFVTSMGRRGLFFSGETETGLRALTESLATSKLGVDRELAGKLLEQDLSTRERILSDVEKIVKDAQSGRKEALDALKDVGLTVIGDRVVPTLAAQKEARVDEAQQAQLELSQARFELSKVKSTQEMANAATRIELAQARFETAQLKQTAAESKSSAAIQLYNNTIQQTISAGLPPEAAVEAASEQALLSGVILGVEEQNAILQFAATLQQKQPETPKEEKGAEATKAKKVAGGFKPPPLSKPQLAPAEALQPFSAFFGRLFGQ